MRVMEYQTDAQRMIIAFLIIVASLGAVAFIGCLASPPGFLPGLRFVLAMAVLGVTCLVSYPLVIAYWLVSDRPIGVRDLLIVHTVALSGFVAWWVMVYFD